MNPTSFGDAALSFQLSRRNSILKTDLGRFASEMSSGEVTDRTRALGGDTSRFSGIEHSLKILDTFSQSTRETGQTLSAMQTVLTAFDNKREGLSSNLLAVSKDSPAYQVDELSRQATATFSEMVSALNTRVADRSLFGGAAVERAALADASTMMASLETAVGPTPLISDVITAVDAWFDDPAGGFATLGYTGDTGAKPTRHLNESVSVSLDARADEQGLRDVLKAAALASLTERLDNLTTKDKATLLFQSGVDMQSSAVGVAHLQSRIGFSEQDVERASVENTAQKTVLSIQRNDSIGADPFETASKLQSLQIQLETHYAMTARLSRLSLVEYLR